MNSSTLVWALAPIMGAWLISTIGLLLCASGRIGKTLFSKRRRHFYCGLALGALAPVFLYMVNEAFSEYLRDFYIVHFRITEELKADPSGGITEDRLRYFADHAANKWLTLRDYLRDFILIFSVGVGGGLLSAAIAGEYLEEKRASYSDA